VNLNGHETGNGGYSQGNTYGNSPFLDPTMLTLFICISLLKKDKLFLKMFVDFEKK
jgi:hypothetical protein